MTPRLAAALGCAVGVVAGYLGTVVALSVWAWEERANGSDVTPAYRVEER